MSGHLLWSVFVDGTAERCWRETLGQADMDAWCAAHGWDSKNVLSGSVNVFAYRDGHIEVTADFPCLDLDGRPIFDPATHDFLRITRAKPLARSLPEGIGTVIR